MKRREIRKNKNSGAPKWMVTYSDMVTLILVFFILLFSMSQIDAAKFEAVSESFRDRVIFDFYPSPVPMEHPTESVNHMESGKLVNDFQAPTLLDVNDEGDYDDKQDSLSDLMEAVNNYLEENKLEDVITAKRTERGVILVLQEQVLFDSAEAVILNSGKPFLNKIGTLLDEIPNAVKVEGHTDNRPISNYRYPSNWELSGARAGSVVRYFIEEHQLDEARFLIGGYGDTRPVTKENNEDAWRENRRVEIVILDSATEQ